MPLGVEGQEKRHHECSHLCSDTATLLSRPEWKGIYRIRRNSIIFNSDCIIIIGVVVLGVIWATVFRHRSAVLVELHAATNACIIAREKRKDEKEEEAVGEEEEEEEDGTSRMQWRQR